MRKVGLWDSEEKIRNKVQNLKTKKIGCLKKNQQNIYKKSFKMKELLKFSSKGKVYDVDKLLSNLLELVKIRRSAYIQRFSWENIYIQG